MKKVVLLICLGLLGGCSSVEKVLSPEPWVLPYERGELAQPIMQFSRNPLSDKFRQHVFDTREGARGAGVTQGGGCGCN